MLSVSLNLTSWVVSINMTNCTWWHACCQSQRDKSAARQTSEIDLWIIRDVHEDQQLRWVWERIDSFGNQGSPFCCVPSPVEFPQHGCQSRDAARYSQDRLSQETEGECMLMRWHVIWLWLCLISRPPFITAQMYVNHACHGVRKFVCHPNSAKSSTLLSNLCQMCCVSPDFIKTSGSCFNIKTVFTAFPL